MMFKAIVTLGIFMLRVNDASAKVPDSGYSRKELQPLTKFRQQHRKTVDGRLCAAAFVQSRQTYTGIVLFLS